MRRFLIVVASALGLTMVSCDKETGGSDPSGKQEVVITCGQASTKVTGTGDATTGAITFKWQNGDYLYVQDGSGAYQYFPIEAGAGTVSGKFRGEVSSSADESTVFNVQWPDTTPDLTSQTYVAGGIEGAKMLATRSITGLSNLKKSFELVPQYAVVRLELKGSIKVKTLNMTVGSSSYSLDCPSVQLSDETAVTFYVVVSTASSQTLSLNVTDADGNVSPTFQNSSSMTFDSGKTYMLKELIIDRDGAASANAINGWTTSSSSKTLTSVTSLASAAGSNAANCYRIDPTDGFYRFPLCIGNTTTSLSEAKSVIVVWETVNTSKAPAKGTIISEVYLLDGWCYFKTTGTTEGNALIAVSNGQNDYGEKYSGTILWSWHIWKTDKPSDITYANSAGTLMDRNLGALAAGSNDPLCAGFHYQWGRKDPFPGPVGVTTSCNTRMKLTGTQFDTVSRAKAISAVSGATNALQYSRRFPYWLITYPDATDASHDWYSATVHTNNLWGTTKESTKATDDPCPPGYKVPYGGSTSTASFYSTAISAAGYAQTYGECANISYSAGSSTYPPRAIIKDNGGDSRPFTFTGYTFGVASNNGAISHVGDAGQYWTSTRGGYEGNSTNKVWHSDYASCLNVATLAFSAKWGSYRADACAVRCMKIN